MREYGRWIKNIAAFFLLMALLSLLLPFCRFQAAGEKVELSGMEVLATAGRAGITYARHNEIPDSFVVKEPFTWGEMKNGFSYAQDAVGNKTLLGGASRHCPAGDFMCFVHDPFSSSGGKKDHGGTNLICDFDHGRDFTGTVGGR